MKIHQKKFSGILLTLLILAYVSIVIKVKADIELKTTTTLVEIERNILDLPVTDSTEIFYDDGEVNYGWSSTHPGAAAVRFTPPITPWSLTSIKVFGSYGTIETPLDGIFYLEIWDNELNQLFHGSYIYSEYFGFEHWDWTIIDIPDITVSGDFYICVGTNWVIDKHVLWLGADNDPPIDQRSYWVNIDMDTIIEGPSTDTDWMIRALGALAHPSVIISTEKSVYTPGDTMLVTIELRNPGTDVDVVFVWYLWLPEFDYWHQVMASPLSLPEGYDETFDIPLPIGNWGGMSFYAWWVVALLEPSTWDVIDMDYALWFYLATGGSSISPDAFAEQVEKAILENGLNFP
jgi:hypothetical protein